MADIGLNVVIDERYATLGGVCLNVDCIPSKALLLVAAVMDEVSHMSALGLDFGAPVVDIDKLRGYKEKVIGKLTGALAAMAKMRKVTTVPAPQVYDLELQAVGGTPNGKKTAADKAGVAVTDRGFINVDVQNVIPSVAYTGPEAHGHGKILGGGMVGTHAGDMIGEIALAIEIGAGAVDIGKTIHPHPTLGESIGMAAEFAHGSCTDVPPARK